MTQRAVTCQSLGCGKALEERHEAFCDLHEQPPSSRLSPEREAEHRRMIAHALKAEAAWVARGVSHNRDEAFSSNDLSEDERDLIYVLRYIAPLVASLDALRASLATARAEGRAEATEEAVRACALEEADALALHDLEVEMESEASAIRYRARAEGAARSAARIRALAASEATR